MSTRSILFNAGAAVLIIAGIGTGIRTKLFPPEIESCLARYQRATTLSLDAAGQSRGTEEFQAAANGQDAGVVENLEIRRDPLGRYPAAMIIKFDTDSARPSREQTSTGGIVFPWATRAFQGQEKACLTYAINVPADFKFARSGTLPGFLSVAEGEAKEAGAGFDIRPVWTGAALELAFYVNNLESERARLLRKHETPIPRERWVRIDQELVLNTPGQSNGIVRLWLDGNLVAEDTRAAIRRTDEVKIGPIGVDVHFSNRAHDSRSPQNQKMMLSPIEVRWN
jgi:hypothetical protein